MIKRYSGKVPTRAKTVVHNGLVYTVATAPNKSAPLYEQTREALAAIDRNLAEAGSSKSRILRMPAAINATRCMGLLA
jgi:enamine deaminase RidA (YjgF/YER057c/UK114 family)